MNLRPPGPQPGALPDCATPRGIAPDSTGSEAECSIATSWEHMFVQGIRYLGRDAGPELGGRALAGGRTSAKWFVQTVTVAEPLVVEVLRARR